MKRRKSEWATADGNILEYKDMDSRHLFNSIRMVFNNIAPTELQIPGGNKYEDIKEWPVEECSASIRGMIEELETRRESLLSVFFTQLSQEEWRQIKAIKVYNEMRMI